jgi:hypothetical protein
VLLAITLTQCIARSLAALEMRVNQFLISLHLVLVLEGEGSRRPNFRSRMFPSALKDISRM